MKDYDGDASSTLLEDLNVSEQVLNVNDTSLISVGSRIIIDSEIMYVKSLTSTTLTVYRGYSRTIAAEHYNGATINVLSTADDAQIIPGDDFGFGEETLFFSDGGGTFSPTRKIDIP